MFVALNTFIRATNVLIVRRLREELGNDEVIDRLDSGNFRRPSTFPSFTEKDSLREVDNHGNKLSVI